MGNLRKSKLVVIQALITLTHPKKYKYIVNTNSSLLICVSSYLFKFPNKTFAWSLIRGLADYHIIINMNNVLCGIISIQYEGPPLVNKLYKI